MIIFHQVTPPPHPSPPGDRRHPIHEGASHYHQDRERDVSPHYDARRSRQRSSPDNRCSCIASQDFIIIVHCAKLSISSLLVFICLLCPNVNTKDNNTRNWLKYIVCLTRSHFYHDTSRPRSPYRSESPKVNIWKILGTDHEAITVPSPAQLARILQNKAK